MRDLGGRAAEAAHNLPSRLTSFVGREREIAEITALLGGQRLVTLVGAPGVGKTRLSLQLASAVLETFPDGVWLVELAPLSDPSLVPQTVADVLGVREQPGRSLADTLAEWLRTRHLLLLLDNCEHLIGTVAVLTETLLQACPDLHVLATSREPLAIEGEQIRRVPSLSVTAEQTESEAGRLFLERARAVAPAFSLTERTAPVVTQICERLDGIPLALELAAARVRTLSVEQITARLDDRFRLLTGGSRTALPRQQTLRGAVDWSYGLLSTPEQMLLRRLAVFAGGFDLSAAEYVGGGPSATGHGDSSASLLDLLTALVDKSLVQIDDSDRDEHRYRLLETFREYGLEKLTERGEQDAVHKRHRNYFLALVAEIEPHLTGPGQAEALHRLDREHDNLRAALTWSLHEAGALDSTRPSDRPDPTPTGADAAVRLAGGLWRFWWARGHSAEALRWLETALAGHGSDNTSEGRSARANARWAAAHHASHLADYHLAIAHMEEALALWRQNEDDRGVATALQRLGVYLVHVGQTERGMSLCEQSVTLARSLGNPFTLAIAVHSLAIVNWFAGDLERSVGLSWECLALVREVGYTGGIGFALRFLGRVLGDLGDTVQAMRLLEEALAVSRGFGDKGGIAEVHSLLAHSARKAGDTERALAMLRISLPAHRELGERWLLVGSLQDPAGVLTDRGTAAPLASTTRAPDSIPVREQLLTATRLLGAAETLRQACGVTLPAPMRGAVESDLAILCAHLAESDFAAAWGDGRALSYEQAMESAVAVMERLQPLPTIPAEPRADPEVGYLTQREREVVALVAQGHTNRQIAAALVLSERTVDTHVHNVLGKLELATRSQIAVWAVEHGLGGDR